MRCYKLKKKGFTLIELIITLAITVIVLGVIYTFAKTSSMTLTKTNINSTLQEEAEIIQRYLVNYGTQAEKISEIIDYKNISFINEDYDSLSSTDGKLDVTEIKFKVGVEYFTFLYDKSISTLTLKKVDKNDVETTDNNSQLSKVLSTNVTEFKVRPLDYRINSNSNFEESTGLEISLKLNKKKGYSYVTIPLSVIVKFRNKD